ncbi:energy transducer TonB [uncultured Proteiniphilum sp.]|uniref:energy transducer TonB n=1 Tax=uncultured Proteiniphilum sp. TaxID=497637 RepID=UPI002631D82A|nr:energy transducer TonB [uncultured Proteiniphilum sp.]
MSKKDEVKKSPKANLERQRNTYILMGLVLGISLLFFAFEWSTETRKLDENVLVQDVLAEEEIEITRRDPTPPPPPPPPEPEAPEIIEVVDEKVDVRMEIQSEDDQSQKQMQTYVPPPPPKPKEEEVTEEIFVVVEEQPEFPGGNAAMMKFLGDNIKYPVIAQENGIQGRVICNFVVERDGSITDVQVVRGVDPSLDREAIRVIQQMPRWKPGKQRGSSVRVRFTLPVVFRLQN